MCTLSSLVSLMIVEVFLEPTNHQGASSIILIFCTFISQVLLGKTDVFRIGDDNVKVCFSGICLVLLH